MSLYFRFWCILKTIKRFQTWIVNSRCGRLSKWFFKRCNKYAYTSYVNYNIIEFWCYVCAVRGNNSFWVILYTFYDSDIYLFKVITLFKNNIITSSINRYSVIRSLSVNKADSKDDLYSDNFKHATDVLIQYITLIINCMIYHSIVSDSFLKANVVPIPMNRRVDLTDSNNYRAIAISRLFSKLFDKIIINKQSTQLKTSDYQFGFKKHSSTIIYYCSYRIHIILCR